MALARPIPIPGNGSGSSTFLGLTDTPDSFIGQALKTLIVGRDETGVKFVEGPYANIKDYGAAGVVTTTTLDGGLLSGSGSAVLTDASSFESGQGMAIPGAGVAGAELVVELLSVDLDTNTVTFTPATSTTVSSGTTVHHDDTVAIKTAIATKKPVFAPKGQYNVLGGGQTTIRLDQAEGQHFFGVGHMVIDFRFTEDPTLWAGTVFYTRSTDQDVFCLVYKGTAVHDFSITADPELAITAGAGVVLGDIARQITHGDSTGPVQYGIAERIFISHTYDGLRVEYSNGSYIQKICATAFRRYGFYMTSGRPTGGNYHSDLNAYCRGLHLDTAIAGIFLDAYDTNRWDNINAIGCPINFYFRTDKGDINTNIFTCFTNEGAFDYSVKMEVTNYTLSSVVFSGGEMLGNDIDIWVGPGVDGCVFKGIQVGSVDISGTNTQLEGLRTGAPSYTNHPFGITIRADASGTQVQGCSIKGCQYGIVIEDGATNNIIVGNDFDGTTADYSASATALANTKSICNTGFPDTVGGSGGANIDGGNFLDPTNSATTIDGGTFA